MAGKNRRFSGTFKTGLPVWIIAAATLIFGLALLIWPGITTELILNICGAGLILVGAFNIVRYFLKKDSFISYNWDLGLGLTLACAGLALIVFKGLLLSIVPLLFGIALLLGGIAKIQVSCNLRRMAFGRWYLTLIGAAVSCLLGGLIVANPFSTSLVLIRVIGVSIAIEAVQDLASIRAYNKTVTHFVN